MPTREAPNMLTARRPVYFNQAARTWTAHASLSSEAIDQFHHSLPNYQPTPLIKVDSIAKDIGVGAVYVKDETDRFGLPAFKILGASWGSFRCIAQKLDLPLDSQLETVKGAAAGQGLHLYAATEGNHGRAMARMAAILGLAAEIHVPSTMHPSTMQLIQSEGATVVKSKGSYDNAIHAAASASSHDKGILVQDHAFGDYRDVPQWIVDGYMTMLREVDRQLGHTKADLVIAPVGVGSFAQAVTAHYKSPRTPRTTVVTVEPDTAACLWKSLQKGELTGVATTNSIMAGLNCATPSTVAWDVLKHGVDASLSVSDFEAHESVLYLRKEADIQAGPCGAATLAALRRLTASDKECLGLNETSTVVLFCTERARDYDIPFCVSGDDPVQLTQTLVQINSASPALGSVPGPGETAIARYISAWLEHRDIETHWIEPTPGRPSVVGVARGSGGDGGGKSLMLNGHIDTVTVVGYDDEENPLSGKIANGRVYGRGAADMKAGVAAQMIALASAKKSLVQLRGDVIFTGVADEEANSIGTEDVLRAGWRADAAVVAEPTNLDIIHAHKGFVWVQVTVHGVAAHGSREDVGVDAIVHAGYFLAELGRYAKRLEERGPADPTVGTGTVHASKIVGGEEVSSYPAQCIVSLERRTVAGETTESVVQEIEQLVSTVAESVPGFKARVKVTFSRPPYSTPAHHPFTKLVSEQLGKVTGRDVVIRGERYWTDCALLSAEGILPLLCGPSGDGFHGKEEWADVESIRTLTEALTGVVREFCK